ncbi:Serine/threonine protein kinase [Handroanthus impetiginosus]|uniref:Serine/threonine protein kinase n=1 Tax=Handroanthus impetiginosus TaxID=429701 RepID=A0A2G9G9L7_9LAMI|nr:Serine/threonine protein kinase [Handroanthus impetiginosus]
MEKPAYFFILISILSLSSTTTCSLLNKATDQESLIAFKSTIISDPYGILTKNWSANASICSWIDLSYNNFTGFLPNELSNLSHLELIDFRFNSLTGEIPSFGNSLKLRILNLGNNFLGGNIPYGIFNLSSIEKVDLIANNLEGGLPKDMCNGLSKLSGLHLSKNLLSGQIPFEIHKCSELMDLSLSFNHFNGSLPSSIGWLNKLQKLYVGVNSFQEIHGSGSMCRKVRPWLNLSDLRELSMQSTFLTGEIPLFIFNMSSLEAVDFSNNSLSGSLPLYHNLPNLEQLFLDSNLLTGTVLDKLWDFKRLWVISLSDNTFKGEIPKSFGNLTIETFLPPTFGLSLPNLQTLYLEDNKLSGIIPSSVNNSSSLTILTMLSNSFTGPVPNLGNLRLLKTLLLGENNLIGEYPNKELGFLSSLTSCRNLQYKELSLNQLNGLLQASIGNFSDFFQSFRAFGYRIRGSIPVEIGNIINLRDLYLESNELTRFIPRTMGKLKRLIRIYLEYNKLEGPIPGPIPECFSELKSMSRLYLDSNMLESNALNLSTNSLSGPFPSGIEKFKVMKDLDLSFNKFSSNVPGDIDKAESLVYLSLAHNKFQGSIPQSIGNLRGLEVLDLSFNSFLGFIPKSLESLTYLKHLNVSYNKLEGKIPIGGNFANFTAESFVKNDGLCGETRLKVPHCGESVNVVSLMKYIIPSCTSVIIVVIVILVLMRTQKLTKELPDNEISLHHQWGGSSYMELVQATNDFSESNKLGNGGTGSVFIGMLSDGLIVAIKVFNLQSEKISRSFDTKVKVLRAIRHRNLIKIISCCCNQDFKALVLEYTPNRSLGKWLHSHNLFLDLLQRLNCAIDVALALEHLHLGHEKRISLTFNKKSKYKRVYIGLKMTSKLTKLIAYSWQFNLGHMFPIVHCDFKPRNVLLDKDMIARVGDFGIAKPFGDGELMSQTRTLAMIGYMAPEYGAQGIVSIEDDIYSIGIMLLEICKRRKPTGKRFGNEISLKFCEVMDTNLIRKEDHNFLAKEQCLSSMLCLAMECLATSPSDRISIGEVVSKLKKIRTMFLVNNNK